MEQIVKDVLTEMYAEAEPPIDFQEILDNPNEHDEFYKEHALSHDRQEAIINKHAEKNNLSEGAITALYWSCILQYGPTEVRRGD